jgi:hypothetical protein
MSSRRSGRNKAVDNALPAARKAAAAVSKKKTAPADRSKPRHWSKEEDAQLRKSVEDHSGKQWKKIAEAVPNRNHVQCLQRWKKVLAPGLIKGHWTKEEDQLLIAHRTIDFKNWGKLAKNIKGRTAKQCRERWYYNLNPEIVADKTWSKEEDKKILDMYQTVGSSWSQIGRALDGRTENSVKTRFKSLERGAIRIWSADEDALVKKYYGEQEATNSRGVKWDGVVAHLPHRTKNACKQRFRELKDPDNRNGSHAKNAARVGGIFQDESMLARYLPALRKVAEQNREIAKMKKTMKANSANNAELAGKIAKAKKTAQL